jgi:hypothetical protein
LCSSQPGFEPAVHRTGATGKIELNVNPRGAAASSDKSLSTLAGIVVWATTNAIYNAPARRERVYTHFRHKNKFVLGAALIPLHLQQMSRQLEDRAADGGATPKASCQVYEWEKEEQVT